MTNAHSFKIFWPPTNKEVEIRVEYKYYDFLNRYWPNDFANLLTAIEVLKHPNRIFSGLHRPINDSDAKYCIAGKPSTWFVGAKGEKQEPFPKGHVYLVFLNDRFSLFEYGPEPEDIVDSLSPEGWGDRFGELIWTRPKNS